MPGRRHELIGNLCTDLGRETLGTEDFRINIDHKISEAEARASHSEAIPLGETPEQRKREFQEALRKILRVGQDRNSSNKKVWTEALHLLDNSRVRVQNYKRPKTHSSADGASFTSNSGGRRRSTHDLARLSGRGLSGRVRTGSARNRGEPLGVFLAASLNV
jgi:hypothetical protein